MTTLNGGMDDEDKWLAEGIAGLQHNAHYMHRALVNFLISNFHFVLMHRELFLLSFCLFCFVSRGFQNIDFSPYSTTSFPPSSLNFLHTDLWYWYFPAQFPSFCKLAFFFRCFTNSSHENWDEGVWQIHNSFLELHFISLCISFFLTGNLFQFFLMIFELSHLINFDTYL